MKRSSRIIVMLIGGVVLASLVTAFLLGRRAPSRVTATLVEPAPTTVEAAPGSSDASPTTTAIDDASGSRMKHPAHGYLLTKAYFEEHQVDDSMNQDVLEAVRVASENAIKNHFALVVTCHGADAFVAGGNYTDTDLIEARFQTIRKGLIARGLPTARILSDWGDPALVASAAKLGGPMQSDRPTCYLESAVAP